MHWNTAARSQKLQCVVALARVLTWVPDEFKTQGGGRKEQQNENEEERHGWKLEHWTEAPRTILFQILAQLSTQTATT